MGQSCSATKIRAPGPSLLGGSATHIPREDNKKANTLAQQVSGYNVTKKYFNMRKPMRTTAELLVLDEPVRPDAPTGLTAQTGLTGLETGMTG